MQSQKNTKTIEVKQLIFNFDGDTPLYEIIKITKKERKNDK